MLFWPCCVTNRLHNKGGYTPTVKPGFITQPDSPKHNSNSNSNSNSRL
ncbi:hypothetical protein AcetOrient_orf01304 [Acetobacter orientalis]|uniref:Uncharacterized protein n=1 Tax=Acetobacter orientalis TaxID=146474 RepID=A0A2Z5ZFW7_9PROT|nr:hypothetical protein AcetOrient_orf01304 [Acetobacter orientalis]